MRKLTDEERALAKEKKRESNRKYRERNKERLKEKDRIYHEKNRERLRERAKEYYRDNKEACDARNKAYYEANKEACNARTKAHYEADKERQDALKREWYYRNKEMIAARNKERYERIKDTPEFIEQRKRYREENRPKRVAAVAARSKKISQQTPWWAKDEAIEYYAYLREEAEIAEQMEGITYHVDHICPVKSGLKYDGGYVQLASGLHVAYNFQLIPAAENMSKQCLFWPDMWDYSLDDLAEFKKIQDAI